MWSEPVAFRHRLPSEASCQTGMLNGRCRGLDNAGKTTIVKRINGEDISTVSPTLGFNIKTMEYNGCFFPHTTCWGLCSEEPGKLTSIGRAQGSGVCH